jgi:LEA14-like dessication related protein
MPLLREPSVTLEGVKIRAVTLSSLVLDVAIRVQNPNPVGVTLREIPFLVLIRDDGCQQEIASGNAGNVSIPARGDTILPVPVTSRNSAILSALASFVAKGEIGVTIKGNAVIDAVITGWSMPFEKTVSVTMEKVAGALNGKSHEK